jgi:two-component system nitrate/nitrite response regulator NarL
MDDLVELTERQRQVLQLASEGLSHREIAVELGVAYQTVKNHMTAIFDKLNLERRSLLRAIVVAYQRGEISL